jgi:hypothetical protein
MDDSTGLIDRENRFMLKAKNRERQNANLS